MDAGLGATSYQVLNRVGSGAYTQVTTASGTSFTVTGLINGTTYQFVVRSVNQYGTSVNSNAVSATPVAPTPTLTPTTTPTPTPTPTTTQLQVQKVEVTYDQLTSKPVRMFIHGANFDNGGAPDVTLGDLPLLIDPNTPPTYSLVVVDLTQPDPNPGTYRLRVSTGSLSGQRSTISVTLGAQGPQGAQDPAGVDGAEGPQGPTGPAGPKGEQGSQGPAGPKGDAGAAGPAGPQGSQGAVGPAGPAGQTGAAGPEGPPGPKGDTGAAGATGPAGPAGAAGAAGPQGPAGPAGPQGAPGDLKFLPSATQTATLADNQQADLIDLQLNGGNNTDLGTSGTRDLISLRVNGTFRINGFPHARDMERFRVDNAGGILSVAGSEEFEGSVPVEGSCARFMWYPGKRAIRAGYVNGTQWDDANVGLYSAAFGYNARASGDYGFAAGQDVVAANSWSTAFGHYSTASGAVSVALGYYAHTNSRQGSFVFSDRSVLDDDNIFTDESFRSANNHTFNVRATGGYYFFTNTGVSTGLRMSHLNSSNASYGSFVWTDRSSNDSITPTAQNQTIFRSDGGYWLYSNAAANAGVTLAPGGGSWNSVSDRNMKANFTAVNPREILRGVLGLPISTWNYKSQATSVRHIGPMAQDFFAAFKLGEGDKTISTIDPDGVALAAIQGLYEIVQEKEQQLTRQGEQIAQQNKLLAEQNAAIAQLAKEVQALKAQRSRPKRKAGRASR